MALTLDRVSGSTSHMALVTGILPMEALRRLFAYALGYATMKEEGEKEGERARGRRRWWQNNSSSSSSGSSRSRRATTTTMHDESDSQDLGAGAK